MEAGEILPGGYRVRELHRTGGMGEVWFAEDAAGTQVVVKTVRATDWYYRESSSQESRDAWRQLTGRFARERTLLGQLDHPAIPRLLHHGAGPDGIPYMVMEHIAGTALDSWLKKHTVTVSAAASILVPLLETLGYAHEHDVVHRDIKPANMIIDGAGRLHLIDFGIAFVTDPEATRYTDPGLTPGSAGYKAPELIQGAERPAPAADLYSAGCVAFLLFAGKLPFNGQNEGAQNYQHLHTPPPRIRESVPHLPPDLDEIVWRMMTKDPADRPGIPEIHKVLRRHLPGADSPAPNPAFTPDPTAPYRTPATRPRAETSPQVSRRTRRGGRLGGDRPDRARFARLLAVADEEIKNGVTGPGLEGLAASLGRAADAWGRTDHGVAQARLRLADMDRLRGDCSLAAARYREVVRDLRLETSTEARELVIRARIGIAECHIWAEDLEEAVTAWKASARAARTDAGIWQRVRERLREVEDELVDRKVIDRQANPDM